MYMFLMTHHKNAHLNHLGSSVFRHIYYVQVHMCSLGRQNCQKRRYQILKIMYEFDETEKKYFNSIIGIKIWQLSL